MPRLSRLYCVAFFLLASTSLVASLRANDFVPKTIETPPGAFAEGVAHVQGFCCDDDALYVVFLNYLYKLDWNGVVVKKVEAAQHAGDPCLANGKLYVAMSTEDRESVREYDLDLNLLRVLKLEELPGCDGIAYLDERFYIGGPKGQQASSETPIFVFDKDFNFIEKKIVDFGVKTNWTTQSIASWKDKIFCAFYIDKSNPKDSPRSIAVDANLDVVQKFALDGSNGWYLAPRSKQSDDPEKPRFVVCRTFYVDKEPRARFLWYEFDNKSLSFKEIKE